MAKKLFDLVKDRSDAVGWPKVVLLMIADHANSEDGTGSFAAEATMAAELGIEERTVRRAIETVEYGGELEVTRGYDHQRKRRATNRYRVRVEVLRAKPPLEAKPPFQERLDAQRRLVEQIEAQRRARRRQKVTPPGDTDGAGAGPGNPSTNGDGQVADLHVQEPPRPGFQEMAADLPDRESSRLEDRESSTYRTESPLATGQRVRRTPSTNPQGEPPVDEPSGSASSARSARSRSLARRADAASRPDASATTIPASPAPNPTTPAVEPASPSKASPEGEQGTTADGGSPADHAKAPIPELSATLKALTPNGHAAPTRRRLPPEQPPTRELTPEELAERESAQARSRAWLDAHPAEPATTTKRGDDQ